MSDTSIEQRYRELLGFVPDNVKKRSALARLCGQEASIEAVEVLRESLIHHNPLDRKTQQLIHFAMLLALGHSDPARLHVRGALKAGAEPGELYGICETAAIVGGMPAFSRGIEIVYDALVEAGRLTPE